MNTMPISLEPLPECPIIDQLNLSMYQVDIFKAALDLELWAKVQAGLGTAEELAKAEGWDLKGTRMLLDDICTLGLLTREGGRCKLPPEAAAYLLPDKPTYLGRVLAHEYGWEGHGELAEAIRTGRRPIGYTATKPESIDTWIAFYVRSWACPGTYLDDCDAMWETLGIRGRDGLQVLDIACGPAPKTFSLARHHSGVRLTLLDWEPIVKTAVKAASNLGVEGQVTLLPGDLWSVHLPRGKYDVLFLGYIAHFLSPEENASLFRKAFDALASGGAIIVNSIRREYPKPTAPELWFYAVSSGGDAYDFAEYRQMLERAGFRDIVDVSTQPIRALKP